MALASAAPDFKFATVLLLDQIGQFALEIQEFLRPFGGPNVLCAQSYEEFSAALMSGDVELAIIGSDLSFDNNASIASSTLSAKVPTLWLTVPDMVHPLPSAEDVAIDYPFSMESFQSALSSALALSRA